MREPLTGKWNSKRVRTCVGPQALTDPLDLGKGEEAANIWKLQGSHSGYPRGSLLTGASSVSVTVPTTNSRHTSDSIFYLLRIKS